MKRTLALFLSVALLLSLAACKLINKPDPEITTFANITAEAPTGPVRTDLPALAQVTANWAWGVSNGSGENPATHLALTGYAKDCDFAKLDLAVGRFGPAKVSYAGEKKGDDSSGDELFYGYFADYKYVTGPYFAFEAPIDVTAWQPDFFLMDSSAAGEGLVALRQSERFAGGGDDAPYYPPASYEDISKAEALHPGRKIEESQLLAASEDGARVCMFRYETLEEEGLFSLVCFDGEKALSTDYTTDNVGEDGAYWRADLEVDDIGLLEPVLLCRTREGILLIVTWTAPEGTAQLVLYEKDGALEYLDLGGWLYDTWGDEYFLNEYEEG